MQGQAEHVREMLLRGTEEGMLSRISGLREVEIRVGDKSYDVSNWNPLLVAIASSQTEVVKILIA